MENYIAIIIHKIPAPLRDIFLAWLVDLGFEGFEERDDALLAFIPQSHFDKSSLSELIPPEYHVEIQVIEQHNWNEEWEKSFTPVIIDHFVAIRAAFHPAVSDTMYEIIITPKMSFGTGHHPTTHLMLQMMRSLEFRGRQVLDFGTGTGVLAILAEKMGSAEIIAIDYDEWSLANARENFEQNNCQNIRLIEAGYLDIPIAFDIILANLTKNVILENLHSFRQHLKKDGVFLCSGLLIGDEHAITEACKEHGWNLKNKMEDKSWIAMEFECQYDI